MYHHQYIESSSVYGSSHAHSKSKTLDLELQDLSLESNHKKEVVVTSAWPMSHLGQPTLKFRTELGNLQMDNPNPSPIPIPQSNLILSNGISTPRLNRAGTPRQSVRSSPHPRPASCLVVSSNTFYGPNEPSSARDNSYGGLNRPIQYHEGPVESVGIEHIPEPTSPQCVPWLKKFKVVKKIRRNIGIGATEELSPNNMPPLLFHSVHGNNIQLFKGGAIARRVEGFCNAIAFSNRPVKLNEKVKLKFLEVCNQWDGAVRLGFTNHDPSSIKYELPSYACPELTRRPGFWAKGFIKHEHLVKKNTTLSFWVNGSGKVRYEINGKDMGTLFRDVDTLKPLYALLDIYGKTTAIEIIDPRAHLNNSSRSLESPYAYSNDEASYTVIKPSPSTTTLNKYFSSVHYPKVTVNNLKFHRSRGKHVEFESENDPRIAIRYPDEYANAYLFTTRPIQLGETIVLKVLETEPAYSSSMAFGLTSCDPVTLHRNSLPDDSHLLLQRQEYWAVKKEVFESPIVGDELAFSVSISGAVQVSKNGGPVTTLMQVPTSIPLFLFFDLYGTTQKVALVGSILPKFGSTCDGSTANIQNSRPRLALPVQVQTSPVKKSPINPVTSCTYEVVPPELSVLYINSKPNQGDYDESVVISLIKSNNPNISSPNQLVGPSTPKEGTNLYVKCSRCNIRPIDATHHPCGHMSLCMHCALDSWKIRQENCQVCGIEIKDVVYSYKSA